MRCYYLQSREGVFIHSRADKFAAVLEACELLDLGADGQKFTWFRKCSGVRTMAKRLDRALSNLAWRHEFPEAFLENLPCLHSDHAPILLRLGCDQGVYRDRPFHFQAAWVMHPDYTPLVQEAWEGGGGGDVGNYLQKVRDASKKFNMEVFGHILKRKKTLEGRIAGIQRSLECWDSRYLEQLELELRKEYDAILAQEEILWYKKSRVGSSLGIETRNSSTPRQLLGEEEIGLMNCL